MGSAGNAESNAATASTTDDGAATGGLTLVDLRGAMAGLATATPLSELAPS